ncbi:hypothetical protein HD553DRAFT_314612 [Filobasidium floriforme]|uniref:uncharacterized protein n=1 Tax=Filobasidium floriforme TaxID=5210 RepID=UPI001E8E94A6|nr:uncharacterized protein HD553DRAFT_314612 [Filobasidium floriforme]KAH8082331.1 hypothetical protein HD553DRAFT_314612 [Filobasidium floriforme]
MVFDSSGLSASLVGSSKDGNKVNKVIVHPGQSIRGTCSIDKPSGVEKVWVEVVGIQYASAISGGGKTDGLTVLGGIASATLAINQPSRAPTLHTDKTFFRTSQELQLAGGSGNGQYSFEVVVPEEEDEFVDVLGKGWGKSELPPSLYLGRRHLEGGVIGFNRYHVTVSVTRKSFLKRSTKSISLPFFLIPIDPNPHPSLAAIGTLLTPPDVIPEVPSGWIGRGTKEWAFKKGNGLKGFMKGGRAEDEVDGERFVVQISTPDIPSWPSGISIPYHLTIEYLSSAVNPTTSNPIDLARIDPTLRLLRACKIVVGKDSQFVTEPIKGNDFSVNREGVWVGDRKRVEMGELRCTTLPNVSNVGIRMQYDLELDISLPSDSLFGNQSHTFGLFHPKITSNVRRAGAGSGAGGSEVLPAYSQVESWVGEEYWNGVEGISKLKEK